MAKIEDNTDLFNKVDSLKTQFPEVFFGKKGIFDRETQVNLQIKLLKIKNQQMQLGLDKEKLFWDKVGTVAKYGFLILLIVAFIYFMIQVSRLDAADVVIEYFKNRPI